MNRRRLLVGLGALIAAPAVVRTPGLLMPVRSIETDSPYRRVAAQWGLDSYRWVVIHGTDERGRPVTHTMPIKGVFPARAFA